MMTIDLYPFQEGAVDSALERGNLLVAFEMGTGKTVIALAIMEDLIAREEAATCLVVVPSSLKWQWAQAIARAVDVTTCTKILTLDGVKQELTVPIDEHAIVIDGSKDKRAKQYDYIQNRRPDYIILGYENIVNDWNYVRRIKPDAIFLDEITAIKTFKAQRTRKIKRLTAPYRFGLTGTPVENGKPEELFSIMQWIDPEVLGRFDLFDNTYIMRNIFGGVQRYKNLPVLHQKLSEVMVRKTRRDPEVAKYLPQTQESNLYVDLDPKSKKVYKALAGELLSELQKVKQSGAEFDLTAYYSGQRQQGGENSQQGKIMARMQAVDMFLDHPSLIVASGKDYEESLQAQEKGVVRANWAGSKYCYQVWKSGLLDGLTAHPKLDVLQRDLQHVMDSHPENKVIIFSFFRHSLDVIDDMVYGMAGSVQYHGGMSAASKAAAVAKFQSDPECRIFICSHAGAFGTDLHMANYLYNYDLAWSSGTQDQINARHSRAASKFSNIYVRNLLTRGTTEPRKYDLIAHKRRVGSAILDNVGADNDGRVVNDVGTLTDHLMGALAA